MQTKGFSYLRTFFLQGKAMTGIRRSDLQIYYVDSDNVCGPMSKNEKLTEKKAMFVICVFPLVEFQDLNSF